MSLARWTGHSRDLQNGSGGIQASALPQHEPPLGSYYYLEGSSIPIYSSHQSLLFSLASFNANSKSLPLSPPSPPSEETPTDPQNKEIRTIQWAYAEKEQLYKDKYTSFIQELSMPNTRHLQHPTQNTDNQLCPSHRSIIESRKDRTRKDDRLQDGKLSDGRSRRRSINERLIDRRLSDWRWNERRRKDGRCGGRRRGWLKEGRLSNGRRNKRRRNDGRLNDGIRHTETIRPPRLCLPIQTIRHRLAILQQLQWRWSRCGICHHEISIIQSKPLHTLHVLRHKGEEELVRKIHTNSQTPRHQRPQLQTVMPHGSHISSIVNLARHLRFLIACRIMRYGLSEG